MNNRAELITLVLSFVATIVIAIFLFSFISGVFKDAQKEIGGQGGLSSIIAKGMDAVEEFKEDVQKKRKK